MAKKVYFCGSMRGGRDDEALYHTIIQTIVSFGAEILTEFVGWDANKLKDQLKIRKLNDDKEIHDQDVALLEEADAVVAEVTQPSLGVGYEIGRAVAMNKKILCLFRPSSQRNLSAMIRGAHNGGSFIVKDYEESQVNEILKEYISNL